LHLVVLHQQNNEGMQKSDAEKNKEAKGPRANNYGVDSNVPPDNPTKCVHMLDVEDLQVPHQIASATSCRRHHACSSHLGRSMQDMRFFSHV
jgi:hypothetical protein